MKQQRIMVGMDDGRKASLLFPVEMFRLYQEQGMQPERKIAEMLAKLLRKEGK